MRTAEERWIQLNDLLTMVERVLENNARLDAYVLPDHAPAYPRVSPHVAMGIRIGKRLDDAVAHVEHELDRLTAERLDKDLERKKRRTA